MGAFTEYVELHRQLRELIDAGKGESKEAEDIADRMDVPWCATTVEEQEMFRAGKVSSPA